MKKITLTLIISVFTIVAYTQIILNGDFENNTAGICSLNLTNSDFNTTMNNCFAFGLANEIDIQDSSCGYSNPEHGNWFISLSTRSSTFKTDGLSLFLNSPFISGNTYQISYFEKADTTYQYHKVDSLLIGISSDSTIFGTQIYSSQPYPQIGWTQKFFTFTAPLTGKYLTLKNKGAIGGCWNLLDDFQIISTTATIENLLNQSLNIFPNPTNGNFTILIPPTALEIQVFNSYGKLVQTKNAEGHTNLNFELKTNGIYLISLITNTQIITKKFVVYK